MKFPRIDITTFHSSAILFNVKEVSHDEISNFKMVLSTFWCLYLVSPSLTVLKTPGLREFQKFVVRVSNRQWKWTLQFELATFQLHYCTSFFSSFVLLKLLKPVPQCGICQNFQNSSEKPKYILNFSRSKRNGTRSLKWGFQIDPSLLNFLVVLYFSFEFIVPKVSKLLRFYRFPSRVSNNQQYLTLCTKIFNSKLSTAKSVSPFASSIFPKELHKKTKP